MVERALRPAATCRWGPSSHRNPTLNGAVLNSLLISFRCACVCVGDARARAVAFNAKRVVVSFHGSRSIAPL